ncbi:MAG: hypothetical protein ACQERJ_02095 [Bacillota bacterium]
MNTVLSDDKSKNKVTLEIKVNVKSKLKGKQTKDKIINLIAEKVINNYLKAITNGMITLELTRGYDIFIAENWEKYEVSLSPSQWRQKLNNN